MNPKLSILICRIPSRYKMWERLQKELYSQIKPYGNQIQVLSDDRMSVTVGEKRNKLVNDAEGEYLCQIDDDDNISPRYIEHLMSAIEHDCDCASLKGMYSVDGVANGIFEHSIKYNEWKTTDNGIKYERYPTPLNLIRSSIAKQFKFPEINFGEDHAWSKKLHESGLLKTEYYIDEIIYYYLFVSNKNKAMEEKKLFSQNSEEVFIMDYFSDKPNGKFIDIGAYHTEKFSNVRALYNELNFKGVLVEPAPSNFLGIAESYKDDKNITVLNVAIGEKNAEIDFYDCGGDAISSSEISHRDKWAAAGVNYTKIKVHQMAVIDFFNQYGKETDFLSIDTESTNLNIFRLIEDWVWETISMLCIEHDGGQEEIEEKLNSFGFTTLYVNAENIILAKP